MDLAESSAFKIWDSFTLGDILNPNFKEPRLSNFPTTSKY